MAYSPSQWFTGGRWSVVLGLPAALALALPGSALAQSITAAPDGTGTIVTESGGQFDITGGTQSGSNLFHSFQQFGLQPGEAATLFSSPDIANILGRVVGGDLSIIDGLLQVAGSSNLYLINPAGIIFGPQAQVIVPGSFTAATATAIEFDEGWFTTAGASDYAALTGVPTTFAFSADPAAVINAGAIQAGEQITLLGGYVVNTGTLEVPGGTITLAAVPGGQVRLSQAGSVLSLELPVQPGGAGEAALTTVDLPGLLVGGSVPEVGLVAEDGVVRLVATGAVLPETSGTAVVSGTLEAGGGGIAVLGEQIGLLGAELSATGADGGHISVGGLDLPDFTAAHTYVDATSTLAADGLGGDGGQVLVWADESTQFLGRVTARGEAGDGGFVEISAQQSLNFDGQVDVAGTEAPGELLLDPGTVIIGDVGTDDARLDDFVIQARDGGTTSTFSISTGALIAALNSGDVTIEATDRIDLVEPVDASGSDSSLALTAPLVNIFEDLALGSGSLTISGSAGITIFADTVQTSGGDITLNGPVDADAFDSTLLISTGFNLPGDVTINGTLDSRSSLFPISVDVQAGDGSVAINGAAGSIEPLNVLDLRGDDVSLQDFSGSSLEIFAATATVTTTGDLTLNRGNIRVDESLTLDVGGNLIIDPTSFLALNSFGDMTWSAGGSVILSSLNGGLDVEVSEDWTITAAEDISLENIGDFDVFLPGNLSATAQQNLTVVDSVLVTDAFAEGNGAVTLQGLQGLTVQGSQVQSDANLTLSGDTVIIEESQVDSGAALSVTADAVDITDGAAPTIVGADDDLTIQGATEIAINALTQPASVFISGGDLSLISDGVIVGNGRFLAGGDVAIATLSGDPGSFLYTPISSPGIVSALGNVSFGDYTGPALKVEATGSISAGSITITGANPGLSGTDPDIPLLVDSSSLILLAGVEPFATASGLPNLGTAQNQPNLTATSGPLTLDGNEFTFAGAATLPATLTVGDIDTSADEGAVILSAPGAITTGAINVTPTEGFLDFAGEVDIASGDSVTTGDISGAAVTLTTAGSITTGDIETTVIGSSSDASTSFVTLTAAEDIQVGYVLAGIGGIAIDAGGSFQALGARPTFQSVFGEVNLADDTTLPAFVREFLIEEVSADFAGFISLEQFLLSLESVDGSVVIGYGQNRQPLPNLPPGVTISGDPSQTFVIGPDYDNAVPLSVSGTESLTVTANSDPLVFGSEAFPATASGTVAGIAASNTDSSLEGSLQSQVFPGIEPEPPPDPEPPNPDPEPPTPDPEPPVIDPELPDPGTDPPDPGMETPDPGSEMPDPTTETPDPGSETADPTTETPEGESEGSETLPPDTEDSPESPDIDATNPLCEPAQLAELRSSDILQIDPALLSAPQTTAAGEPLVDPCEPQPEAPTEDSQSEAMPQLPSAASIQPEQAVRPQFTSPPLP